MAKHDFNSAYLLTAAANRNSASEYRAAVNWVEASTIERIALQWLRKAMQGAVAAAHYDRWFTMVPNALRGATARDREVIDLADCAVERSLSPGW